VQILTHASHLNVQFLFVWRTPSNHCYVLHHWLHCSERIQRDHSKARSRDGIQDDCQCQCHESHRRDDSQEDRQEYIQEHAHATEDEPGNTSLRRTLTLTPTSNQSKSLQIQ